MKSFRLLNLTVALGVSLFASSAMAGTFLPMTGADIATYQTTLDRGGFGEETPASVYSVSVQSLNGNWRKYSSFPIGNGWVNAPANNEVVHIQLDGKVVKLVDFNRPAGTRFVLDAGLDPKTSCIRSAVLSQKSLTVTVPAGQFENVVEVTLKNACPKGTPVSPHLMDSTLLFAPGVGLIKSQRTTGIGNQFSELISASIGEKTYPQVQGLAVSGHASLDAVTAGQSLMAVLTVRNNSAKPADLTFANGLNYDAALLQDGVEIKRWSDNRGYTEMIRFVPMAAGAERTFIVSMKTVDRQEQPLAAGQYRLQLEFKGLTGEVGSPAQSVSLPVFIKAAN